MPSCGCVSSTVLQLCRHDPTSAPSASAVSQGGRNLGAESAGGVSSPESSPLNAAVLWVCVLDLMSLEANAVN